MSINTEEKLHGAAMLRLFEALGKDVRDLSFSLKRGDSRNAYTIEAIKPSLLGKGQLISCGIYLKSSGKRLSPWRYNFLRQHQEEIQSMKEKFGEVFAIFVNGTDGIACLNYSELKEVLDQHHEEQEWVSVSRKPKQAYRVSGNDGDFSRALNMNNYPAVICDYFRKVCES